MVKEKSIQTTQWQLRIESSSKAGKLIPLKSDTTFGSSDEAKFTVKHDSVSPVHAKFTIAESHVLLEDLESNKGTFVNGQKIQQAQLNSGDNVRLGSVRFVLLDGSVSQAASSESKKKADKDSMPRMSEGPQGTMVFNAADVEQLMTESGGYAPSDTPTLTGTAAPFAGKKFSLKPDKTSIGRSANNDIVLNQSSVSSNHAEIIYTHGNWKLVNLLSTNGCFVNGKKCSVSFLKPGDKVRFGSVDMLFNPAATNNTSTVPDFSEVPQTPSSSKKWLFLLLGVAILGVAGFIASTL